MQMHNTRSRVYIGLSNILLSMSTVVFSQLIDNVFMGSVQAMNIIMFILSCIAGFVCLHFYALEKIKLVDKSKKHILNRYFYFSQIEKDETRISKIFENDILYCVEYENYGAITFITNLISIGIFGTYIYVISPIFLIIIFIIGLIQTCIPHYFGTIFSKNYLSTLEIEEKIEEIYYDIFLNFKKTWFFRNDYFIKRIHQYNVQYYHVGAQSEKNIQVYKAVIQMISVISQFGLCFIGLIVMQISDLSLSELLIILLLGNQILSMFISEIDIIKNQKMYDVSKRRIDEIITVNSESKVVKRMCKKIVFNNYHPLFLDYNMSFTIQQNDKILIKGQNGGGKSTVIKSLLNLMPDYSGEIIVDDFNIKDIEESELFFYVPQDFMEWEFKVDELFKNYDPFIINELKKYFRIDDDMLQKNTKELSSGENKIVQIVCAFASKKRILIFDEPENSLDRNKKYLFKDLLRMYEGMIIIVTNSSLYDDLCCREVRVC